MDAPNRYPLLDSIHTPADLRALPAGKLAALAAELRAFLIETVATRAAISPPGSAPSSSRSRFTMSTTHPTDRIVWDVGHQAYPHKVLTGPARAAAHDQADATVSHRFRRAPKASSTPSAWATPAPRSAPRSAWRSPPHIGRAAPRGRGDRRRCDERRAWPSRRSIMRGSLDVDLLRHPQRQRHVDFRERRRDLELLRQGAVRQAVRRPARRQQESAAPDADRMGARAPLRGAHEGHGAARHDVRGDGLELHRPDRRPRSQGARHATLRNLKGLHGPQFLHIVTRKGKGYPPAEADPDQVARTRARSIP